MKLRDSINTSSLVEFFFFGSNPYKNKTQQKSAMMDIQNWAHYFLLLPVTAFVSVILLRVYDAHMLTYFIEQYGKKRGLKLFKAWKKKRDFPKKWLRNNKD